MKILVINTGSSSIKYTLFDMAGLRVAASGLMERIGEAACRLCARWHDVDGRECEAEDESRVADHREGLKRILDHLSDCGALRDPGELGGIGHRVVHGGEEFSRPTLIDERVMETVRKLVCLAPLHNPSNLVGIEVAREVAPGVPQVAVFDTAFHQTLPPRAFRYAVPDAYYRTHHVRRYGFHGTSHQYVSEQAAAFLGRPPEALRMITLHLGNGASAAAVSEGRCVDTSMGMTPLAGLVMGTRCGDLDPAVPFYLAEATGRSNAEIGEVLNKESGLKGICGENDMREIQRLADAGDANARLAIDMFCYSVRKTVGAYLAVLGGADALVFTGGIGEHAVHVRAQICAGLEELGIHLDPEKNASGKEAFAFHREDERMALLVIPTNEELGIARQAMERIVEGEKR